MNEEHIAYGRGFRRCLEMMIKFPIFRIGLALDDKETDVALVRYLRRCLTLTFPPDVVKGFDSIERTEPDATPTQPHGTL